MRTDDVNAVNGHDPDPVVAPVLGDNALPDNWQQADDEAFVTELATSLILLVTKWRERAATYPATWPVPGTPGADRLAYATAADELEAVLRSAT